MTPEGRIKEKVKKILKASPQCYYHMPVQNGMGAPTLDFVGCSFGRYFAIETKAPGHKPTPRQEATIAAMRAAGAEVFVIDGNEGQYKWLVSWLSSP